MRFILGLFAIVLIIAIIGVSTGYIPISGTPGSLSVNATAPTLKVDTPTITVGTEDKTIKVPTLTVDKPGAPAASNSAAPK